MNSTKTCTEIKNQIIAVQSAKAQSAGTGGQRARGKQGQQHQPGNFVARGVRELLLMNTLTHTHRLQSELSASLKKIYQ